ncbi:MAG: Fic family protein, partial [Propionibacteriaceae bacterium]
HIEADADAYARALHGVKSNASAVSMAAATVAIDQLIRSVDGGRDLSLDAVLRSHAALMRDDRTESGYAGRVRDMQNWIGGSDYSPRNALYVPPPPDTVPGYLTDLIRFTNRSDISVMAQAAIAHAQFESIHPFTDGNGRIGRALVNTILRRRGVTRRVVVPLASALVARRDRYFTLLDEYRAGHSEPVISAFALAAAVSAQQSRETATRIESFPDTWRDTVGRVRADSATARLLDQLTVTPIFSADEAERLVGGSASAVYAAVERLAAAGVLRPLTSRKRNQIWGVTLMLDELDDLSLRIAAAVRASS